MIFAYSYKGTKAADMSRPSRKRGKQVKKRGISKEQVCVGTALDRQGNIIIELLCTGSHKSYMQSAEDMELEHKRIKRGRHKEDIKPYK